MERETGRGAQDTATQQRPGPRLTRRQILVGSLALAAAPLLNACSGSLPTPTSAPAAGGGATKPAGTTAPAATKASGGAPTAVPPTATAVPDIPRAKSSAKVTGKLKVIQHEDYHPDHNAFMRAEIQEFCKVNGWDLEISTATGFQGTGDLLTALTAAVQAGNAPDMFFQDIGVFQYQANGVLQPTTDLTKEMIAKFGDPPSAYADTTFFNNEWWGVPFYTRAGGMYVRKDIFDQDGVDIEKDTETYDKLRETALKISKPDSKLWGWGMTINRSGDGNSMVQNVLMRYGSVVQDETGQLVKFNSPETIAGLNWLKDTYSADQWAKMLPPGVNAWTDTGNNEAYLAGTIAITDNAGTMYAKAVHDKVPFYQNIRYIQRPVRIKDNARLDFIAGDRFHLIKGAKNKDAAYDLIRHLLSEPVQKQIWTISTGYALPAYKNGWSDPIIQNNVNSKAAEPIAYNPNHFTGLRSPGPPSSALDTISGGTYYTDMMGEVLQGKSAEDAAKSYHQRFVQIFKDNGLKGE
ncbi:MAG TPA: extracellular solute-binding protein [Thermomicrobiales bacterium]|nr:extracellular solute-binding protein [Thermomicrobiales bacterium]